MSSSKSSSQSKQTQQTTQQGAEGIINSQVLQGQTIAVTDNFPEDVAEAFSDLIELAGSSIDIAAGAGARAADIIAETKFREQQPVLATQEKLLPFAIGAVAVIAITYFIARR